MEKNRSTLLTSLLPWLSPLVIKLAFVHGGIEVQLYKNEQLVKNVRASKLSRVLPEQLVRWMDEHRGPQPYPLSRQLWQNLAPLASKKVIIDASVLNELKEVSQPQDFALVWTLNRASGYIEGHYEGVDHYLGMGWFQKGTHVWQLNNNPVSTVYSQFENLTLPVQQAELLLKSTIPSLQRHLPVCADFQFISDFSIQINILAVHSGELVLGLQCNYPQLLPTIQPPPQQTDVLLADKAVILFPHQAVTPVLASLLQRASALTIQGIDVPVFISDQLPILLQYKLISGEVAEKIIQSNPIISIATLSPTYSFTHSLEQGIGKYLATATYQHQQQTLNINTLLTARRLHQSYALQHAIWFKWPSNSDDLFNTIQQQRINSVLQPEEVMGFETRRTALSSQQSLFQPIQFTGITPLERARPVFEQLRHRGIPGVIINEPDKLANMFINTCEDLLRDNRLANILWLVASNKKGSITRLVNGSAIRNQVKVASLITMRDEPGLFLNSWTFVIFQSLDQFADGSTQFSALFKLKWKWAIASITSRHVFSRSFMRMLHLPENYYEQFCANYLFDLSKSYQVAPSDPPLSSRNPVRLASQLTPQVQKAPANAPSGTPSFWEQARQWKDRTHGPVPIEDFSRDSPTYRAMGTKQLDWYFYWRNEVRNNRYPPTQLSYILVHVYEALTCIGLETPTLAHKRLVALWEHYRDSLPALDIYLIPWIADFCVVYRLSTEIMSWYENLLSVPHCTEDEQLLAEAWLRQGGNWVKIPPDLLYKLAGFNNQTKFYQKNRQKLKLDEVYRRAVISIENLKAKKSGQGLIGFYGQGKFHNVERTPFKGALVERSLPVITVATINAAFRNVELGRALLGILKYADYLQRRLHQSMTADFTPTIDKSWQEAIEAALLPREHPTLKNLISPAAQVDSKETKEQPPGVPYKLLNTMPNSIEFVPPSTQSRPTIQLNQKVISALREESEQLQERLSFHTAELPSIIITPDPPAVIPIAKQNLPLITVALDPVPVTSVVGEMPGSAPEVDEDWKIILQHWQPVHWEILTLLYREQYAQLPGAARLAHRPVSQLIDEINLPVDEHLGDLLVDPNSQTIFPHLRPQIESLMNWHSLFR